MSLGTSFIFSRCQFTTYEMGPSWIGNIFRSGLVQRFLPTPTPVMPRLCTLCLQGGAAGEEEEMGLKSSDSSFQNPKPQKGRGSTGINKTSGENREEEGSLTRESYPWGLGGW